MSLYYVTSAQTPGASPSFNIYIQKSVDDGATWATVYDGPLGVQSFEVLLIDGVLHIFGDDLNGSGNMTVFRFDTATDAMLDSGTDLGFSFSTSDGVTACQFVNGQVLLAFHTASAIVNTSTYLYDPDLNTISAGQPIDQSGHRVVYGSVVDPDTDTAFVFFDGTAGGASGREMDCVAVSNTNVQQSSVYAFNTRASPQVLSVCAGRPIISGGMIQFPFVYSRSTGPVTGTMMVAKAIPANSPVFTSDVVYTDTKPPYMWTLTNELWFIPTIVDVSGTAYLFFQTNINQDDLNTSQANLYYITSTVPGTWSAETLIYAAPASSDALSCYPVALNAGGVGVIACYANPVATFPIAGTLLVKYITLSGDADVTLGQSVSFGNIPKNLLFEVGAGTCQIIISGGITLGCPVDGGSATDGVPYNSGPPIVTGGIGPYTYSLLSGTLPDGLSLDPATGIVSGTPTESGFFSYVLEVTDSSDPPIVAEVPSACPISVGQNFGCRFKLLKVMPTFGPEKGRHLPVRGSVQ